MTLRRPTTSILRADRPRQAAAQPRPAEPTQARCPLPTFDLGLPGASIARSVAVRSRPISCMPAGDNKQDR